MHHNRYHSITRRSKPVEGQATVEFALTIPIFLLLLIGFFGVSAILFSYVTAASAAREGARYVIANPGADDWTIQTQVCATSGSGLGGNLATCMAKIGTGDLIIKTEPVTPTMRLQGRPIDVVVTYRVPIPTISVTLNNKTKFTFLAPITVTATSTMRVD